MPRRSDSKRTRVVAFLSDHKPALIDEGVLTALREHLAPVSNSYLRELVRSCGLPLAPVVEGVRHESLEEAERTLLALSTAYEASDAAPRGQIRTVIIESKDRLKWSLKRSGIDPAQRALKEEILLWTMTWLENPTVFAAWLSLRRREKQPTGSEPLQP